MYTYMVDGYPPEHRAHIDSLLSGEPDVAESAPLVRPAEVPDLAERAGRVAAMGGEVVLG